MTELPLRLTLILQEYDFQVLHRLGIINLEANGLSRNACTSQKYNTNNR